MVVRGFARYLSGIDPRTEIPPAGMVRIPRQWRAPFIYSDADVLALMEQGRRSIPQPLRAATYETLIGLLATTGLRIGEALRLDRGDLDWAEGVLRIRRSKFQKSRLVPLTASTLDALERYHHTRRQLCPEPSTEAFFVSLRGTRVIYEVVWPTHRMLCERAGVGAGSPITPTVHDHRHTFAVKTLCQTPAAPPATSSTARSRVAGRTSRRETPTTPTTGPMTRCWSPPAASSRTTRPPPTSR
jgi:integrase/recombinase XerD